MACIGALPMTAATGFGGFGIRTGDTAGTAVTRGGAVNVDAGVLILSYTKRFIFFLAR